MKDYIGIIAEKIRANIPVVLYTVGADTFSVIKALDTRFRGARPVAVCDGDKAKQGRVFRGLGDLPVLSFDDAISRWPDAEFFISSIDWRFEIIGELATSGKIANERIINYEPVEKRVSCVFWEKLACVNEDYRLRFCCQKNSPIIALGNTDLIKPFSELRQGLIRGTASRGTCGGCHHIREGWYPVSMQSWWINYFGKGICNYKCKYCTSPVHYAKKFDGTHHGLGEFINALRENNILSEQYSIYLSTSGEPTLHPKRKDFYDSFNGYVLSVNTNGSIFDKDLFALMQEKMVRLIVSLDAGTHETYKNIKGLDCLDMVHKNLKQYAKADIGIVVPKYILMPGINDNENDIDSFTDFCIELNVPFVIIAYDKYGIQPIPNKSVQMIQRMKHNLDENGVLCIPYIEFETLEYVTELKKAFEK